MLALPKETFLGAHVQEGSVKGAWHELVELSAVFVQHKLCNCLEKMGGHLCKFRRSQASDQVDTCLQPFCSYDRAYYEVDVKEPDCLVMPRLQANWKQ